MLRRLSGTLANILVVLSLCIQGFTLAPVTVQRKAQTSPLVAAYPCPDILYDFSDGLQGWSTTPGSTGRDRLSLTSSTDVPGGKDSLSLTVNLSRSHQSAEYMVDMRVNAPGCARTAPEETPLWAPGSTLSVRIWAPAGARGDEDPAKANGAHLFVVDDRGHKMYGTWQHIQENTWSEVTLRLEKEIPACGSQDIGFNPDRIRKIGINIGLSSSNKQLPETTFLMAGVTIKDNRLPELKSDHLYSFESVSEKDPFPRWDRRNKEWKAQAFTNLRFQEGAALVDSSFANVIGDDKPHKGVLGLDYRPALDIALAPEEQNIFSVDVRFETSMVRRVKCPFQLSLWLFDEGKQSWYSSDTWNVGATYITRVAFPLSSFKSSAHRDKALDLRQIGKLAIQVWGNTDYQGKIWFDNIALGGEIPPQTIDTSKDKLAETFITTNGPHFQVGAQRFRFIGANAEYLQKVSDPIVEDVMARAETMGIKVIRTWGFSEGCEDKSLDSCEAQSRYFQPAPGIYNQSAFEHFDHIIMEAKKHHIRLIVPLANNWPEYGGIPQYVCWQKEYNPSSDPECPIKLMADDLHDKFYTDENIKTQYKNYITDFVNHVNTLTDVVYKNDPTIMAWELINEPRAPSDQSGETLHNWIWEMSDHLEKELMKDRPKELPLQLIGVGEEGWYIKSKQAADASSSWQDFPKNYWHYGVNWQGEACTGSNTWGSNGVDFLSDHSSDPQKVSWQKLVGDNRESPAIEQNPKEVKAVDYTTIHLYPAPGETNLPKAPYCDYEGLDSLCSTQYLKNGFVTPYHQAKEWIAQHVDTSHNKLQKPFILEEFNFPIPQGEASSSQADAEGPAFRVTPEERARLFTQYLNIAYNLDVDGVMFWNLGYEGFADQRWSEAPSLRTWAAKSQTDSLPMNPDIAYEVPDPAGIRLDYDPKTGYHQAGMVLGKGVDWLRADGNQVYLNLRNDGDAQSVMFRVLFSDGHMRLSEKFALNTGVNHLVLDKLFQPFPSGRSKEECPPLKTDPARVVGMIVTLRGYTAKGSAYFDFHSVFSPKYVIYPGDPVEKAIHPAVDRLNGNLPSTSSFVKINEGVTCDSHIRGALIKGGIPIEFTLTGGREHPNGYVFQYMVKARTGPLGQPVYMKGFGSLEPGSTLGRILIQPAGQGYNVVWIAAEVSEFDGPSYPSVDSCGFWVDNEPPHLTINGVWANGNALQRPYDTIELKRTSKESQVLKVELSGADDVSPELQLGCRLLREGKEVSGGVYCEPFLTAATPLQPEGKPSSFAVKLSPGTYQLELWLEDENFGKSDTQVLQIKVP